MSDQLNAVATAETTRALKTIHTFHLYIHSSAGSFGFYDALNISASFSTVSVKSPTNFAQRL